MAATARGGFVRTVQQSFSGGMYRSGSAELIPANACFDLTNTVLDRMGGLAKRGGTSYRSTAAFGEGLRWIWDGRLKVGGQATLLASTAAFGKLEPGGGVTSLGEGGLAGPVRPAVYEGVLYFPGGKTYDGEKWGVAAKIGSFYTVVANRLLCAEGNKIFFSKIGVPGTFEATDFHQLPEGVQILGLAAGRDSAVVFTTGGIWVISNLALNLTDAAGNVQQRLDHYSGELVLWGDSGISAWEGSLLVPAIDAVWLIKRGVTSEQISSFVRLSDPIRDLYQEYVKAGYQPGGGCVFANHYLLPIIGGGRVQDVLVCRLDIAPGRGQPPGAWSHFNGFGGRVSALAARVTAGAAREPELLGVTYDESARALTCSYFSLSQSTHKEADGSTAEWAVETRSYTTANLVPNFVSRLRARYQMNDTEGSPKITAEVASDHPVSSGSVWGLFVWGVGTWSTPGSGIYEPLTGEAPADLEGASPYVWNVRKKRRFVRFRLACKTPVAQLSLKALELFVRPQGRL